MDGGRTVNPARYAPQKPGVDFQQAIRPHPLTGRNLKNINSVEVNTVSQMKALLSYAVLAIMVASVACTKSAETYLITFLSSSGEVIGSGSIDFRTPVPATGKARGKYVLSLKKVSRNDKHTEWFYRLLEKRERGEVELDTRPDQPEDFRIVFDFSPDTADANIGARASDLKDGRAEGIWSYAIFSGGYEGGRFEIRRK